MCLLFEEVRGVLLSFFCEVLVWVALLLVFGGLLVAADAVFQQMIGDLFKFDVGDLFNHLFLTCAWFWIGGGLLWGEWHGGHLEVCGWCLCRRVSCGHRLVLLGAMVRVWG